MKKTTINNELTLSYNEHFRVMTSDELVKYCGTAVNHWGIRDEESHGLFIVSWTRPGFLNFLTDAKSVLGGSERCMKKNLCHYDREDSFTMDVAGNKAHGIRFTYDVTGTDITQIGETSVFRANKKFYVIQYVSRLDHDGQNRGVYHGILRTVAM